MKSLIPGPNIPLRDAKLCILGIVFVVVMFAHLLPASAAVIGVQPGVLEAVGEPAAAINSDPFPDLLLVRRGGGGRKAYRRGGGGRKAYRSRGHKRRSYRGRNFYFSIPYYGYVPYYSYYSYRPYYGRCEYWHRRCVDNWGYRNSDYYGCMRYYGCY